MITTQQSSSSPGLTISMQKLFLSWNDTSCLKSLVIFIMTGLKVYMLNEKKIRSGWILLRSFIDQQHNNNWMIGLSHGSNHPRISWLENRKKWTKTKLLPSSITHSISLEWTLLATFAKKIMKKLAFKNYTCPSKPVILEANCLGELLRRP